MRDVVIINYQYFLYYEHFVHKQNKNKNYTFLIISFTFNFRKL